MRVDPNLLEFADTEMERKALKAIIEHGTCEAADRACGKARSWASSKLNRVRRRAASLGYAPNHFTDGVAPGFQMGKVTIQRGPDGIERVWERQHPQAENVKAAIEAAAGAFCEDLPRYKPVGAPKATESDLCALYTLTDAHVGMLAWHREGGEDWDLEIAERVIIGCFAQAIKQMPNAEQAIFNQLGDLLHYDSLMAVTPTSGHILDADSRFTKMVEATVRIIRCVVDMLLAKHRRLHVIMAEGNHDMASSVWLRTFLKALYEEEPRITVDDSALPYYAFQWGKVMLGFHHSHLKKQPQLPLLMAAQFPEIWGATEYRYGHTGDKHHAAEKDENGIHLIQHPTLAARDAYAARGGWFSQRNMSGITYHKEFGQVGRVTVNPKMLGGVNG